MRTVMIAVLVAASVGLAAPVVADAKCHTTACDKRVAKKEKIHRLGFKMCNTWACVKRVKTKRAARILKRERREMRHYKNNPLPWCAWGPESPGYPEWSRARYRVWNKGSTSPERASGKFQIIGSTWRAFGGLRYAVYAAYAKPVHQERVARRIAADGLFHWVNC